MKTSIYVLLSFPFLIISTSVNSQVIWYEDFESYSIGTGYIGSKSPDAALPSGDYPSSVTMWSLDTATTELTATSDWISVQDDGMGNQVFEFRDSDGEFVWSSESISILGYLDVALTVSATENSNLESTDYINIYYKLDGGEEILFETNGSNPNDFTSSLATQENITGSTIQIIVRGKNNAGTEQIRFDNIIVAEKSLLITEVSSPSDNSDATYIEIENCSNHTLDFDTDTYYLSIQTNGGTWSDVLLTGSLCSGCVTLYAQSSSSFNTAYGFSAPQANALLNGNGNDAYFIYYNGNHSTGTKVDSYGVLDVDGSGELWEYSNSRAVRNTSSVVGLPNWVSSDWTIGSATTEDMSPGALENELRYYSSIWHPTGSSPSTSSDNLTVVVQEGSEVISEAVECSNLFIYASSTLHVNTGIGITVSGNCVNNGILKIVSDANSSASIIVDDTSTGNLNYDLYLTGGSSSPWHLISAPVKGQSISSFVANSANSIQTSVSNNYGLAEFNTSTDTWNYFHNGSGSSPNIDASTAGVFQNAKGYSVLRSSSGTVSFSGMMNTNNQSISLAASKWNLIGNPYPSYIGVNNLASSNNILSSSTAALNDSYEAIYLWDASSSQYDIINHVSGSTFLSPGQAFYVLADADGGGFVFTETMQSHQTGDWFQRRVDFPTIKLIADFESTTSTTEIKYVEGATDGLDVGYDAGRFGGDGNDYYISTLLVDGSRDSLGLGLQCLSPFNELYENKAIPVSVFVAEHNEVVFRIELVDFPENISVFLEDVSTGKFTRLGVEGSRYSTKVMTSAPVIERFFIHTKGTVIETAETSSDEFLVYLNEDSSFINIVGSIPSGTKAYLFDALGRLVSEDDLNKSDRALLDLPLLSSGVYFLLIRTTVMSYSTKIILP